MGTHRNDDEDNSTINLKFLLLPILVQYRLGAKSLAKSFGDKLVLDHINLIVKRGKKLLSLVKTGEGKSTLVKCINR